MFIDASKIGAKGLLLEDSVDVDEDLLIEEDSFFAESLHYSIFFTRDAEKIRVRGQIRTLLSLRCVSCVENFDLNIDSKFDLILFPVSMVDVGHSSLKADEMEYIFYEGDNIDLEKILLEQVNLFIPYNPTCSSQCNGICPNCGINLNYEECQCENTFKETEMNLLFNKLKR
ncbi:MAG: DUF177 domain-containing protein [bacterium]|nr:DUF177 domain-containing protein [bacterium]